jgi:hypothetical protein
MCETINAGESKNNFNRQNSLIHQSNRLLQNRLQKKQTTSPQKKTQAAVVVKPKTDTISKTNPVVKQEQKIITSTPLVLKTRENALVRRIETEASEIKIELYDNGDIDGDTISIYHNNALIRSHMRLSHRPISVIIGINPDQPHHEIVMVPKT